MGGWTALAKEPGGLALAERILPVERTGKSRGRPLHLRTLRPITDWRDFAVFQTDVYRYRARWLPITGHAARPASRSKGRWLVLS